MSKTGVSGLVSVPNLRVCKHLCMWCGTRREGRASWMCQKQTAVSHSSTESEIISLDTGLRLHGLPALELWDLNCFCLWKYFSYFRSIRAT